MTIWLGLVTAINNHYCRKSFTWAASKVTWKNPQTHNFLAIRDQEMKMSNRFSGKLDWAYIRGSICIATREERWILVGLTFNSWARFQKVIREQTATLLNLIVNFTSAKTMGEFRTQNLRGNFISRCEKTNKQTNRGTESCVPSHLPSRI